MRLFTTRHPVARLAGVAASSACVLGMLLSAGPSGSASAQSTPAAPAINSPTTPVTPYEQAGPTVSVGGTAPDGSQVGILDNGALVGGTTADPTSGAWTASVTLLQGTHSLTAEDSVAGDTSVSLPSSAISVTIDGNELVTNGDFSSPGEEQFPPTLSPWQAASALYPQDTTANCNGEPYETPIRGESGFGAVPAYDNANQFAELAPGCVLGLAQSIPTVPGTQYILSFAFMARPGTDPDDNTMSVNWGGTYLAGSATTGSGLQGGPTWQTYQYAVSATSASTTVEFDDTNASPAVSVGDLLVGVSVQPAAVLNPNTSWQGALPITPNATTPTQQPLDFTGESLWYDFPVQPGQEVTVALSNLPADYQIDLYSDISQAYNAETTSTQNPAALAAETPGAAFSNSAFSNSAFSNSAFSNSAFSNSAFSNSAFSNSAFSNSAFSNSAFSNSAFSNSAFSNSAFSAGYSAAEFNSLEAISTTPGAVNKSVTADTWNNTGNFYIRITGNNGAAVPFQDFNLNVTTSAGTCVDGTGKPIILSDTDTNVDIPTTGGTNQTVIVWNSEALSASYTDPSDTAALSALPAALTKVAGPQGVVVDLSTSANVTALAQQAASNPQCPFAENLEAEAIQNIINSYRVTSTNLKYVVIVGDDNIIPFFRYPDFAGLAPESDYSPPLKSDSAANTALQTPDYLSDDQYGAASEVTIQGSQVPLPTAAVGRLVETPTDILGTLNNYINGATVIQPKSSLVTGYDFMQPAASQVESAFASGITNGTNTTLITNDGVPAGETGEPPSPTYSWTAQDLTSALTQTATGQPAHYDLAFLGGHFSANNLLAADGASTITTNQFASFIGSSLNGSLVISAGCHSGYGIDSADGIPIATDDLAWPQAFTEAGATLIAGTGYQYGDTNYVAYSDQLYVDLAQQLGYRPSGGPGPVDIGTALLNAEQQYLAGVDDLNGLQEKALLQVTLYGLPMLGIQETTQTTAPGGPTSVVTSTTAATSAPGSQLKLSSSSLDLKPSLNSNIVTPPGSATTYGYLSGPQGVTADPGGPVLPVQTDDVNNSNAGTLRGVGFRGGTYTDATTSNPLLTGDPATETGNSTVAPFSSPVFLPQTMWNPNYFSTLLNDGDTELAFNPVQYRSNSSGNPDARTYGDVNVQLFYSNAGTYGSNNPALASPPAISNVTSTTSGDVVTVSAHVTGDPAAGIQDVWVTYTGTAAGTPLYGSWQSVDLTQNTTDSTLWTGSFVDTNATNTQPSANPAADSNFMVQAVNGVGEVTMDNNNGYYFTPTVTPGSAPPQGANTYTLQLGGDSSGSYLGTASVTATLTAQTGDHSANVNNQPITFQLGGETVTVPTNAGVASASIPVAATPGNYTLTASFAGDSTDSATSAAAPFTVNPASTTLSLTVPSTPSTMPPDLAGASALLTSGGSPVASRTVYFVLTDGGGNVLATQADATNSSGVALTSPIVPGVTPGSYTLTAYFGSTAVPLPGGGPPLSLPPDPSYSASTPASQPVTVALVSTNTALSGSGSVVSGQAVTLKATVTPSLSGIGTPTGTVTFYETPPGGGTQTTISNCVALKLSATDTATCPTSFTPPAGNGPYSIMATYSGDPNFTGSFGTGNETVGKAGTTTVLTAPSTAALGSKVTVTAQVAPVSPGSGTPTGTVTFYDNSSAIGTGNVAANGTASITVAFQAGTHSLTATYGGDSNFTGSSTTSAVKLTVAATRTISTPFTGTITVASGQSLLVTSKVTGAITVQPGGALDVNGGTVTGLIVSTGAAAFTLCAATVNAAVSVTGSTGYVFIGGGTGTGCAPSKILGAIVLANNTGGVEVANNTVIGAVSVTGNSGYGPVQQKGAFPPTEVAGNSIVGILSCSGNTDTPTAITDAGQSNTALIKLGQCDVPTTF
jgi:hypothetical protein